MRLTNIRTTYPIKHLTQLGDKKYIYPYLLRNLKVKWVNQLGAIDITYVRVYVPDSRNGCIQLLHCGLGFV